MLCKMILEIYVIIILIFYKNLYEPRLIILKILNKKKNESIKIYGQQLGKYEKYFYILIRYMIKKQNIKNHQNNKLNKISKENPILIKFIVFLILNINKEKKEKNYFI